MKSIRFFLQMFYLTLVRLCQQRALLAGLALLCLLLPLGGGQAAQALLSQRVDFSPVTLALTAPAGDATPQLLERFMGEMEDVSQYCRFVALEEEAALEALKAGEVTAVLALPEHFIQGVMWGDNPDLRLIAAGDQPLESLLMLWAGQSASDILAAFQSGVYAVLDLYEEAPPPGLTRDQVVRDINVEYIRLALDRGSMFRTETVSAARTLPVALHYSLALLAYFSMSAAPLFVPLYRGSWLALQRRLRAAGRGTPAGYFAAIAAGASALFLLLAPALGVLGGGSLLLRLSAAAVMAVWCSLLCGLFCLAAPGAASCGTASFVLSLAALALAGGIVPPALLPAGLRALCGLSPVTWLMELAAWPMGYPAALSSLAGLAVTGAGMMLLSLGLYCRRMDRQEVEV